MSVRKWSCDGAAKFGSIYVIFTTLASASARSDSTVASIGTPMELTAPFTAVTPAVSETPAAGAGPAISNVTRNPSPRPRAGQDLRILATISDPSAIVRLTYQVNRQVEQQMLMAATLDAHTFTAIIPATAFAPGDMVRWYVSASLGEQISRCPGLGNGDRFFGTVIEDPSVNFTIPVMEWFAEDATASTTVKGANGSSVLFLDRFYDNVFVRRKGVTSLGWPKPKLKFKFVGKVFVYKPNLNEANGEEKVNVFDTNSLYYEPGQKSYMREAIAYQVLQDVGAVSAINFHIILRLNGQFYGIYTWLENSGNQYLERNKLSKQGILIKPTSSLGNLDYAVPVDQLVYNYKLENHGKENYWPLLWNFMQGIAGAGPEVRSLFVFDNVELSQTINTLAVLTMLLTQDRCTKNYFIYFDVVPQRWQVIGYDLKSSLNADAGYHGKPAADYCTLECPQWNSPLFCDRDHPQDVYASDSAPWTSITAASIGRRLAQIPANSPTGPNANISNPDINLVALGNHPQGPANTFNYLVDLITQVPATRQMYMRRLRTLTDYYYPTGRLAGMVTDMYHLIKDAAEVDDQKWHIGNITAGYLQLIEEQIPARQKQLLQQYGPGGDVALLPDSQPPQPPLLFGRMEAGQVQRQFLELVNNNTFAVDVSNWMIVGGASASIRPGTVIAAGNSLVVASDLGGFRGRSTPPMLGQGFQVIDGLSFSASPTATLIQLLDDSGALIASRAPGRLVSTG